MSPTPPKPKSLIGASRAEIEQVALKFTDSWVQVVRGTPQVVLLRDITSAELPALGFEEVLHDDEAKLVFVIVKGDFDVSTGAGAQLSGKLLPARYMVYLFDRRSLFPRLIQPCVGGMVRLALNDPTLPDEPTPFPVTPGPQELGVLTPARDTTPLPSPIQDTIPVPYGATAPPALPPTPTP